MRAFLLLFTLLCLGCVRNVTPLPPSTAPTQCSKKTATLTKIYSGSNFSQVDIQGKYDVNLHTGYKKPEIIIRGTPTDLNNIQVELKGGSVVVRPLSKSPLCAPVVIEVNARFLNAFSYSGRGLITGPRLSSELLDLKLNNTNRTVLGGHINLRKLEVRGPGYVEISGIYSSSILLKMLGQPHIKLVGVAPLSYLSAEGDGSLGLYWVRSDFLAIRLKGSSYVQLAGIVNKLDVELWGKAHFNGRYLRAMRTFAKTHDHSVAEITSIKRQHTLATDASDIFFYKIPEMKADFMGFNGAVLDMRDWNLMLTEDYTRYNK